MKTSYIQKIRQAEKLPLGRELWIGDRYNVILHCIDKLEALYFWEIYKKKFYKTVLKKAVDYEN
jgi:hypothetical protein